MQEVGRSDELRRSPLAGIAESRPSGQIGGNPAINPMKAVAGRRRVGGAERPDNALFPRLISLDNDDFRTLRQSRHFLSPDSAQFS